MPVIKNGNATIKGAIRATGADTLQGTSGADAATSDATSEDGGDTLVKKFHELLGKTGPMGTDSGGISGVVGGGATAIEGGTPGTVTGQGQVFDLINTANSQLGYKEGGGNDTKFGSWAGGNGNPWCAYFVSWCIDQAGLQSVFSGNKKEGLAGAFRERVNGGGGTLSETAAHAGDIIIWGNSSNSKHVGIVAKVEPKDGEGWSKIYTIEGNSGDAVSSRAYTT